MRLAAHCLRRGLPCDVVVATGGGAWTGRVPAGARLVELGQSKPWRSVGALRRYLINEQPRAALASISTANFALLVARLSAGGDTRVVVREANRTGDDLAHRSRLTTIINRLAVRWLYPTAAAVVTLSAGLREHLVVDFGVPRERIHVIPNPLPDGPVGDGRRAPRHTHGEPPLLVACGRLEPQKDHRTLLAAFARAAAREPLRLAILGDGPLRADLQAEAKRLGIADRVEFAGYVSDPSEWMRRADLVVLSSRWEGFPNVLLEALAQGCRVVSTDASDAIGELLGDGRFGRLCPVGDEAALAEAILASLRSPAPGAALREHLRQYAFEPIADRYLALLAGDISHRPESR